MPRKTCKFQLSWNLTKFDVLARFRETIPTVKYVSSSEIQRINFGFFLPKLQFCNRNYDFALFPEIGISRVLHCESGISVILLMVDLRVVDILSVDVILDMDELTAIGLSVIGTLAGLSYPTRPWSWVRLHMHVVGCVCAWNFETKFFLRRGKCKTRENSNFLKNVKIVILVKI